MLIYGMRCYGALSRSKKGIHAGSTFFIYLGITHPTSGRILMRISRLWRASLGGTTLWGGCCQKMSSATIRKGHCALHVHSPDFGLNQRFSGCIGSCRWFSSWCGSARMMLLFKDSKRKRLISSHLTVYERTNLGDCIPSFTVTMAWCTKFTCQVSCVCMGMVCNRPDFSDSSDIVICICRDALVFLTLFLVRTKYLLKAKLRRCHFESSLKLAENGLPKQATLMHH